MIALFFDTETTGLPNNAEGYIPRIVQLGAIMQDMDSMRVLAELNVLIRSEGAMPIPAAMTDIHGITTEMTDRYGVSSFMTDKLFAQLIEGTEEIVAHNIEFDLAMVQNNMGKSHEALRGKKTFCTKEEATDIVKAPLTEKQQAFFKKHPHKKDRDYKAPHLYEAYRHFYGKDFENAHDAMADVRACRDVYIKLKQKG